MWSVRNLTVSVLGLLSLWAIGLGNAKENLPKGGWIGTGSDNAGLFKDSAWFLGSDPIQYCIQMAQEFGASNAQVVREIQSSVQTWEDYVSTKRIVTPEGLDFNFNFRPMERCDGSEDITFYMGTENDLVTDIKKNYENPTAFAKRVSYDREKGRGKGFIWVSSQKKVFPDENFPDWTKPYHLHAILLHEIGHIFGTGHISGTIMDENLSAFLRAYNQPIPQPYPTSIPNEGREKRASYQLTHIDDLRELVYCVTCGFDYVGMPLTSEQFKLLVDRDPVGSAQAKLSYIPAANPTGPFPEPQYGMLKLILTDGKGKESFRIEFPSTGPIQPSLPLSVQKSSDLVFAMAKLNAASSPGEYQNVLYYHADLPGILWSGAITSKSGKKLNVAYSERLEQSYYYGYGPGYGGGFNGGYDGGYSMGQSILTLLIDGKPSPLFIKQYPGLE